MSESTDSEWLGAGSGLAPYKQWAFTTDAPLVAMEWARESGEVLAADASGGLYHFDRGGQLASLTRGYHALNALALADTGEHAIAAIDDVRLCRVNRQLRTDWSIEMSEPILAVATDPHGHCFAASLADGRTVLYDSEKRRLGQYQTHRPLRYLQFLSTEKVILGSAEHGLFCRYELPGREIWADTSWANVGGFAATGNGRRVYVAGYTHGIRVIDGDGQSKAGWIPEGTTGLIACSFVPKRVVAATQERHLYWLDEDGEMLWGVLAPEDIAAVQCDPLGKGMMVGFQSGRLLRLDWETVAV